MAITCKTFDQILCKHTEELRPFEMDLSGDLAAAETITAVTFSDDSSGDITRTLPTFSGKKAQVTIAGGTSEEVWVIKLVATTSLSNIFVREGRLEIE